MWLVVGRVGKAFSAQLSNYPSGAGNSAKSLCHNCPGLIAPGLVFKRPKNCVLSGLLGRLRSVSADVPVQESPGLGAKLYHAGLLGVANRTLARLRVGCLVCGSVILSLKVERGVCCWCRFATQGARRVRRWPLFPWRCLKSITTVLSCPPALARLECS